ncbi:hypothetical protein [Bosea sp. BK604]|uniref:hypothetical protein n=1 Tax=Bosea sp. BK604 TaxID=2512180 RepID=UPI00104489D4|nr:hypothetical protein [Bosea sp. BK604]
MIRSIEEACAALARVEHLSGCTEASAEETELIALVFALEVWEAKEYWRASYRHGPQTKKAPPAEADGA